MKNKTVGFIIILVLLWVFAKDNESSINSTSEQARSFLLTSEFIKESSPSIDSSEQIKTAYINANALKVRETPGGKIIKSLPRGFKINVYEQQGDWSRISAANEKEYWVSSSYLCSFANCYVKKATSKHPSRSQQIRSNHQPAPKSLDSHSQNYDSSCPCSSGTICIGPRGGRYCITSGGNKRYGV